MPNFDHLYVTGKNNDYDEYDDRDDRWYDDLYTLEDLDLGCLCIDCRGKVVDNYDHGYCCLCSNCEDWRRELEAMFAMEDAQDLEKPENERLDALYAIQESFCYESPTERSDRAWKLKERRWWSPRPHTRGPRTPHVRETYIFYAKPFHGRGPHNYGRKPRHKDRRISAYVY